MPDRIRTVPANKQLSVVVQFCVPQQAIHVDKGEAL